MSAVKWFRDFRKEKIQIFSHVEQYAVVAANVDF
jgi:hypothetical protein